MKILNLYAGIGGNRKLWEDKDEITAIEINEQIAMIYKKYYPKDKIIIDDAHKYLLEHFQEYDFIWSSPPCPSHSRLKRMGIKRGIFKYEYPDMRLYQEIILLQNFYNGKYVIENVKPYYSPLISPNYIIGRHYFWSNIILNPEYIKLTKREISNTDKFKNKSTIYGFNIEKEKVGNKVKILRNLVDPAIGVAFYHKAKGKRLKYEQKELFGEV